MRDRRPIRERRHALAALVVATLVAGCTSPTPAPDDPSVNVPRLSDYSGCPWTYPDGRRVDCHDRPQPATPLAELSPAWLCVASDATAGWSLHWEPHTGQRALRYTLPTDPPAAGIAGVLRLDTDDATRLYSWTDAPADAFVLLAGPVGETVTFHYLLHDFGYAWNATALAGAEASSVWSIFNEAFWAVHRLDTDADMFTFPGMAPANGTQSGTGNSSHNPANVLVNGEDFTFAAVYTPHHEVKTDRPVAATGFDQDCALEPPLSDVGNDASDHAARMAVDLGLAERREA